MSAGILRVPTEVLFGSGSIHALTEVVARHGSAALVCTDLAIAAQAPASQAIRALESAGLLAGVFDATEPDLPRSSVERCVEFARERAIDVVIGLGGGSCIDVAKAAAILLKNDTQPLENYYGENRVSAALPVVGVPTTAGTGSEVSPVAVVSDPRYRLKTGVSSIRLIPRVAICDPDLTLSCPSSVTAFSGIDALAHAVEAVTAGVRERDWRHHDAEVFQGASIFSGNFGLAAVSAIAGSLERVVADGSDRRAREQMLYGSLCAGIAFGNSGTAGAHALQYPIGALTSTPHGLGVGLVLPYVLDYTKQSCLQELSRIASALGIESDSDREAADLAIAEIQRLAAAVGVPTTLGAIGVSRADLPRIAEDAASVTRLVRNSARTLDPDTLSSILEAAWEGRLAA